MNLHSSRDAGNGMYYIKSGSRVERVYCYMGALCGERGWTMILKANGHRVSVKRIQVSSLFFSYKNYFSKNL